MSGYVEGQTKTEGPDLELVKRSVEIANGIPVICEGRVHTSEQAALALEASACAVVVGTAITHPTSITNWFVDAMRGANP